MILLTGYTSKTTVEHLLKRSQLIRFFLFVFIVTASISSCTNKKTDHTNANQQQQNADIMNNVLIIGMDPHTIDFTSPEIPQGLTVEIIEKGANAMLETLHSMGYNAELFLIETGTTDLTHLTKQLTENNYDGVVIGNGIRSVASNFILFEQIINVIHVDAPESKIIFNTLPTDTDEAVKRWL